MGMVKRMDTSGLIRQIEDNLTRMNALVSRSASHPGWATSPRGDAWSAQAVMAHVRASDEILTPRVYQILVRDNPPLAEFEERRWAEVAGYDAMPAEAHFARIAIRRYELLQTLRALAPDDWQRIGTHESRGEVTLAQIVELIVAHETEHFDEIERLLGVARS